MVVAEMGGKFGVESTPGVSTTFELSFRYLFLYPFSSSSLLLSFLSLFSLFEISLRLLVFFFSRFSIVCFQISHIFILKAWNS